MAKRGQSLQKARAARRPTKPAVDLKQRAAELERELAQALERLTATSEALVATSDVLKVISRSTFDVKPVLATVAETAARLCQAEMAFVSRRDGDVFRYVTAVGTTPETMVDALRYQKTFLDAHPFVAGRETTTGRVILEGRPVQIADLAADPEYRLTETITVAKIGTVLGVPLMREGEPIGVISLGRQRVEPFTERQIDLVRTFADQAVIAIENTRLLTGQREALEQQTAIAEVLQVINSSPGDLVPVFDAILEKAHGLCSVTDGSLQLYDGKTFHAVAVHGLSEALADRLRQGYVPGPNHPSQRLLQGERFAHAADLGEVDDPMSRAAFELSGIRTVLLIPLRKEGRLLGQIVASRRQVRLFTEREIALLESFAAQAVIAIENARLLTETREALEKETATAEVLGVINASPGDLAPVFDAMLEKALRLCDAAIGGLGTWQENRFRFVAARGPQPLIEYLASHEASLGSREGFSRVARGDGFVQFTDISKSERYESGDPFTRAMVDRCGARTTLSVPLAKDDTVLGVLSFFRQEVKPFSDKQIALVKHFAAQAVIAMENARLITETREALEQQTATAEVLQVINSSPGDLAPVFEAILEKAHSLCEVAFGSLDLYENERFRAVAVHGLAEAFGDRLRQGYSPGPHHRPMLEGARFAHFADLAEIDDPMARAAAELSGIRTALFIPLRRDGTLLGRIVAARREVKPFAEKEIALLESFAAQAVIAMENARLLGELRQRTTELARSVDELTATGDVLKIISRSSVELETVLDTLVETVARLCRADQSFMFRRRDDRLHLVAGWGGSAEQKRFIITHPPTVDRGTTPGRAALERRAVHIPDVSQDSEYTYTEGQKIIGYRTTLGIPLLRENALIGVFSIGRTRVEPFTNKEIELASTFADQAVIAIENARLFEELRERQAELRVTFDNMGDGVVMFDAERRLAAWNRNFQRMLELPDVFLASRPGHAEFFRYLVDRGEYVSADLEEELSRAVDDISREMRYERTRPDGRVIEVRRNPVPGGGFVLIYADITERKRAEAAIGAARDAAEAALRELQTAQASLVHAQKMAALGQLTAGIAHEIKNPLNFVNNFAGLSVELLDELKEATAQALGVLDADKRAEIADTIGMLTGNLEKIAEHGRRADGIVKSMLQHSRGGSGDWQASDLNALVEEALNLAYHGARAQDQSFNITMERDLDANLAPTEIVPQDLMRVFLNLIGNGFYAANKRRREAGGAFRSTLRVTTRDLGDAVEIRVRDNGIGIPPEHREKLFQPFFTTKPTGEGTGLGLSISFEIVTQQHGGTITVDSEIGEFTEFTVRLPRRQRAAR